MNKLILFFVCIFLFSCGAGKTSISDFLWLQGKWIGTSDNEEIFEEWALSANNSMMGIGGSISNGDTIFSEQIKIEQRGDDIFYVPSVKQNGGSVDFKFTGYKKDSIIFENQEHDFPQRIIYFKLSNNGLYACIDGFNKGKYMRIEFSYHRAN